MSETKKAFNLLPEHKAKIEAENKRLKPLRDELDILLKDFSFIDLYWELGFRLYEACCETIYEIKNMSTDKSVCVDYVKHVANKAIYHGKHDEYKMQEIHHIIEDIANANDKTYLLDALMKIIQTSGGGCSEARSALYNVLSEAEYNAKMKKQENL